MHGGLTDGCDHQMGLLGQSPEKTIKSRFRMTKKAAAFHLIEETVDTARSSAFSSASSECT